MGCYEPTCQVLLFSYTQFAVYFKIPVGSTPPVKSDFHREPRLVSSPSLENFQQGPWSVYFPGFIRKRSAVLGLDAPVPGLLTLSNPPLLARPPCPTLPDLSTPPPGPPPLRSTDAGLDPAASPTLRLVPPSALPAALARAAFEAASLHSGSRVQGLVFMAAFEAACLHSGSGD